MEDRDASEGKEPRTQPQKRLGRRLEEVAKAVGGGYCRLQMPLKLALGVRETAFMAAPPPPATADHNARTPSCSFTRIPSRNPQSPGFLFPSIAHRPA